MKELPEESGKIIIKPSKKADTRSAFGLVTEEELLKDTKSHISDVQRVSKLIADLLVQQCLQHDHTKIEYLDDFYQDFSSGKTGAMFKDMGWFKKHLTERHHLNDRCPEDVDLIDVLEMVIDCTVAGLARTGEVFPITISPDILQKAVDNTSKLIIDSVEVEDEDKII